MGRSWNSFDKGVIIFKVSFKSSVGITHCSRAYRSFDFNPQVGLILAGGLNGDFYVNNGIFSGDINFVDNMEISVDYASTFQDLGRLPKGIAGACLKIVDHRTIFVAGGSTDVYTSGSIVDTYTWDMESTTWSNKAPLPKKLYGMDCSLWEEEIYVVGGIATPLQTDEVHIYNLATDQWRLGEFHIVFQH